MKTPIIAGIAAGVLIVGLIFSPMFSGMTSLLSTAQAQGTGTT